MLDIKAVDGNLEKMFDGDALIDYFLSTGIAIQSMEKVATVFADQFIY